MPKDWSMRISYDKGQFVIADKDGVPYDIGEQSMIRSYQGERKERVVAKATGLEFVTDQLDHGLKISSSYLRWIPIHILKSAAIFIAQQQFIMVR